MTLGIIVVCGQMLNDLCAAEVGIHDLCSSVAVHVQMLSACPILGTVFAKEVYYLVGRGANILHPCQCLEKTLHPTGHFSGDRFRDWNDAFLAMTVIARADDYRNP